MRPLFLGMAAMTAWILGASETGTKGDPMVVESLVNQKLSPWVERYKIFHQNPELSGQETETSRRMADVLEHLGFQVTRNVGGHGVVACLKRGEGRTLMIRTDMDALPIAEKTGLSYASTVTAETEQGEVGVMHACGHDVHMSVALGTAEVMAELDNWQGTLMVVAQPAEETGRGSRAMIEDGLFDRFPVPEAVLAFHVHPGLTVEEIGITPGYSFANVDTVTITLFGEGGHGAQPHECIDPVVMAAKLILSLQTLISRENNPVDPAVITVGSIHGGSRPNIIPDQVNLQLTVRSFSDASRQRLLEGIRRMAKAVAQGEGMPENRLPLVVLEDNFTPSVYNDPELTAVVRSAAEIVVGRDRIRQLEPVTIGEDFSRYGRTSKSIPICMFRVGTAPLGSSLDDVDELHSPHYAPVAPQAIAVGVQVMTHALLNRFDSP